MRLWHLPCQRTPLGGVYDVDASWLSELDENTLRYLATGWNTSYYCYYQ